MPKTLTMEIVFKHASGMPSCPLWTILGTLAAGILTGTFVIEQIFAIPGMGKYFVESINQRGLPGHHGDDRLLQRLLDCHAVLGGCGIWTARSADQTT